MSKTSVPSILVTLALPVPVAALIVKVTAIANAMAANKTAFPSPIPALATVTAHIAALTAAQAAIHAHTGTVAERETTRKVVIADAHQLRVYVQQQVNANPEQASVIAEDATMTLRKPSTRHKSDLVTKQTVTGSVKGVAKATKGGRSYGWQYSTDGGKTWLSVLPTTQANVTIHGLQSGLLTSFRQRAVTKAGPTEWSQPVSALVS